MDTGFKRLWSRKKSVGSSDQPPHRRKTSSSNGVSSKSSTNLPGRPSVSSTQYTSDRPYSRDRLGSRDLTSASSGDDYNRPKTGHRIQPMLVGISRPSTGFDRPQTAGSLQHAVLNAADSVDHQAPDVAVRQPVSAPSQSKAKQTRHVDIFSVSTTLPSRLSRYNEEVAERNLDTIRLALENTPYTYDPSSKFQEEVAVRNAYLPYKPKSSTDVARRTADHERTGSLTNKSVRSVRSPQPNGVNTRHRSSDSVGSAPKQSADRVSHHSRQASTRSREAPQLPAIIREETDDYDLLGTSNYNLSSQDIYQTAPTRDGELHTITEGKQYQTATPNVRTLSADAPVAEYKHIAATDFAAPQSSLSTGNRAAISDRYSERSIDQRLNDDHHRGPPSTRSTASSTRRVVVLGNRTIMDLTTDDSELVSETSSYQASADSQYSPILEQAKSDAFRRIMPSQIHTEERRNSKVIDPSPTTQKFSKFDSPVVAKQHRPEPEKISIPSEEEPVIEREIFVSEFPPVSEESEVNLDDETTPKKLSISSERGSAPSLKSVSTERPANSPSTFSPISTVASWSPRSSTYVVAPTEPMSMTERVKAALAASQAITKSNPLPISNVNRKGDEKPTVKERVASFENSAEKGVSPSTATTSNPFENGNNKAPPLPSAVQATNPVIQTPSKPVLQKSNSKEVVKTPAVKPSFQKTSAPSIYTSPDSINSVDFVDPSSAFGVRTRDFAVTPQTTGASRKAEPTKQSSRAQSSASMTKTDSKGKSTKPRAKQSATPAKKAKDTGFDEEAFARKQAEARAALEKLKASLNEDFTELLDRPSSKSRAVERVEPERRDSTPAVTLSPEQRVTSPITMIQRADSDKPPPSSFRNSRTEQQRASLASSSRSLSTGSRSSRRAPAPSQLKNLEPATNPIDYRMLSPGLLQALQAGSAPPKSPGEISLSSFPVPSSSRPPSQPDAAAAYHSHSNSFTGPVKRRNSVKSQTSTTSAFSIPYHKVPGRTSSMRNPLAEEGEAIWE